MYDAVMWLRRGWYAGGAVGTKMPADNYSFVDHSIKKVDGPIRQDEISSGPTEGRLENVSFSNIGSRESGSEEFVKDTQILAFVRS